MDVIGRSFKLTKNIGSGAFGEIFHGINLKNNFEVAVKLEPVKSNHPQLFFECQLYQYLLQDVAFIDKGIPNVYYCATEGEYNIMVMDLLGPSLEDLLTLCGRKFTLKTVLMLADQMIERIEFVHSKHFLHRDIKPDNFLIGTGKRAHKLYIIDFGLAKRYIQKDGKHIQYKENQNTRTARFVSINANLGIEQGRRDDLESVGYIMMYFLKGQPPWQYIRKTKKPKYEKIMERKISTSIEDLCQGFPQEFATYLTYVRNLKFDEKPDYSYLRTLLKGLFTKQGFEMDYVYDWNLIQKIDAPQDKAQQIQDGQYQSQYASKP